MPLTVRGYDFFECASAVQKAIRRNDPKIASYFAMELHASGYPLYVWKRLLTIAAEDCFGVISKEIKSLYDSWDLINKGQGKKKKGRIFITKAVLILCAALKSRDADHLNILAYDKMKGLTKEEIQGWLDEADKVRHGNPVNVPGYTLDCHTREGKRRGATKEQFIQDEFNALTPRQPGLFDNLVK